MDEILCFSFSKSRVVFYLYVFTCSIPALFFSRVPLEDVPIDSDEECGKWLRDSFRQKVSSNVFSFKQSLLQLNLL